MQEDIENTREEMVLSYYGLRSALGVLALGLPVILIIGGLLAEGKMQASISDSFHTSMRDIFVGTLFTIGIFLIGLRGHRESDGKWVSNDLLTTIMGMASIGVALFPNSNPYPEATTLSQHLLGVNVSPSFHYLSAQVFFVFIAIYCYLRLPEGAGRFHRHFFLACGHAVVFLLIGINVTSYLKIAGAPDAKAFVIENKLVFWLEAIGLWIFAFAWLVKGKDEIRQAKIRVDFAPLSEVVAHSKETSYHSD